MAALSALLFEWHNCCNSCRDSLHVLVALYFPLQSASACCSRAWCVQGVMVGIRVALACLVAAVMAGCATLPTYRDDPVKTAEVVRHVRCELRDAIRADPGGNRWLLNDKRKGWNVKLSFDLWVDHSGDVSTGDNVWVFPFHHGATFLLTLSGGVTGTGNRRENIEFDQKLQKLESDANLDCPEEDLGRFAQLSGYLGIADLIERASRSKEVARDNAELSKLAYTLEFVVRKTGGLTTRFNLIPTGKEKTFTGTPRLIGSRSDTQRLTLTFAPPASDPRVEACAVVQDGSDWPDPSACPIAVYTVDAKPAPCSQLTDENKCKRRNDCTWGGDKMCRVTRASGGAPETRRMSPPSPEPTTRSAAPPVVRAAPPSSSSGLTPADKANLDNANTRGLLQDIESQLSRQRLGN